MEEFVGVILSIIGRCEPFARPGLCNGITRAWTHMRDQRCTMVSCTLAQFASPGVCDWDGYIFDRSCCGPDMMRYLS